MRIEPSPSFTEFPTHVGMNRMLSMKRTSLEGVSHLRGDEPDMEENAILGELSSPREWG